MYDTIQSKLITSSDIIELHVSVLLLLANQHVIYPKITYVWTSLGRAHNNHKTLGFGFLAADKIPVNDFFNTRMSP